MNNTVPTISDIADILFDENASYGEILSATKVYKDLLYAVSNFNLDLPEATQDTFTTSGKAIAPKWAATCLDDFMRTRKFCIGLLKAVQAKKLTSTGKVQVLYAGTGPFAALVLPLTTRFSCEEVSFTLLELNDYSFQILEKTIAHFKLRDYIDEMKHVDATQYVIPKPESIDILLTETMTHALKSEHQVAISYRLLSQLPEDVILIPEEIQLNLLAVNAEILDANQKSLEAPRPYFDRLGNLFTINTEEIRKHQNQFNTGFPNFTFPARNIPIPPTINMRYHYISVETYIVIYKDEILEANESGLSTLLKLTDLNSMLTSITAVQGTYVCGPTPGLQCRLIN